MKEILFFVLMFMYSLGISATPVTEMPVDYAEAPTTVSISTSAWTVIPTTSADRLGIFITAVPTNSANHALMLSRTAPTTGITVLPIIAKPGNTIFLGVAKGLKVYALSLHTSAESVTVQEVRQ